MHHEVMRVRSYSVLNTEVNLWYARSYHWQHVPSWHLATPSDVSKEVQSIEGGHFMQCRVRVRDREVTSFSAKYCGRTLHLHAMLRIEGGRFMQCKILREVTSRSAKN